MTLAAQIEAILHEPLKRKRPTARELLHAVIEHAHVECFTCDGRARVSLELPAHILDELAEWEADAEDDEVDERAG